MNCKYFKTRKKDNKKERRIYNYCTINRKEITYDNCKKCNKCERKIKTPMKKRSRKLKLKEKNRYSIIYQDLTKCAECGSKIGIEKNEVFEGAYRQTSIKFGMVVPLCQKCHKRFHSDRLFNLKYKSMLQKQFMKNHSLEEFIEIFKQDYIYLLNKRKRG